MSANIREVLTAAGCATGDIHRNPTRCRWIWASPPSEEAEVLDPFATPATATYLGALEAIRDAAVAKGWVVQKISVQGLWMLDPNDTAWVVDAAHLHHDEENDQTTVRGTACVKHPDDLAMPA